jgi:outer membrane immunogenic protein
MKSLAFASTAALLLFATAASAQTADWSGAYIGAQAGMSSHDDNSGETFLFDTNLDGTSGDIVRTTTGANAFSPGFCGGEAQAAMPGGCPEEDSGFEFGARAGYDWQFGSFVVGVVGEATRTNVEDNVSAYSTTPAFYTMQRKLRSILALRARAGFALDRNLFYATGGVARGQLEHAFFTSNTANTFVQRSDDEANGYQWGGGYERQLTSDVTLGIEYLYTKLEDDSHVVRSQGPVAATNPFILVNPAGTDLRRSEEDFEVHSLRMTAGYRF